MKTNKTTIWNNVQADMTELFTQEKVSKKVQELLMTTLSTHLEPKTSGSINPPKLIDGIMNYYCRYHKVYEPESNMVMSQGKSKGYCKAGISVWNKLQREAKACEAQVIELMTNDEFEKAKEASIRAKELKELSNDPKSFDLELDWNEFNGDDNE